MTPTSGLPSAPETVWTVRQINDAARNLLEREAPGLWVKGEVSDVYRARSGHWYFTLKDEEAEISCVLYRWDAEKADGSLKDGDGVRIWGGLTLYEPKGRYQLRAKRIEPEGADGQWKRLFEARRRKLEAEGLIDPDRRRPLPRFPETVGVVTSLSGAALRDVASALRRRAPWVRLVVRGTRVQGEDAAQEVADALAAMIRRRPDVIVVARGGGSMEDLWCFNEEAVARAVAASPVPVVSGVGHETDVTLCDLVADRRAPTPTAAAEVVAPDRETLAQRLDERTERLASGLAAKLRLARVGLDAGGRRLASGLVARARLARVRLNAGRRELVRQAHRHAGAGRRNWLAAQRRMLAGLSRRRLVAAADRLRASRRLLGARAADRVGQEGARLEDRASAMTRAAASRLRDRRAVLAQAAAALEARSPLATLRRGFAAALGPDGVLLRRVGDFAPGETFTLRVVDGGVRCSVLAVEPGTLELGASDGQRHD